jgi:2-polyprenyl-3-methyl-5-hydroxy-6-metoxy-1,4-benzoquinol methylase
MNTDDGRAASSHEHPSLREKSRYCWERKARWWSERIGEGNAFQRTIINPVTDRLLNVRDAETVLEIACGNGNYSRRLAAFGCQVIATDFSEQFLGYAREHSDEFGNRIEYRWLDATDEDQIRALGKSRFDASVCNMALMDMAAIEPLFRGLATVLKPGGRFVFSVSHPCFNTSTTVRVVEQETVDRRLRESHALKVRGYQSLSPALGEISAGDVNPHLYFDRPLNVLMNAGFNAGFVVDGFEEPLDPEPRSPEKILVWQNLDGIPPAVVIRMRLL